MIAARPILAVILQYTHLHTVKQHDPWGITQRIAAAVSC